MDPWEQAVPEDNNPTTKRARGSRAEARTLRRVLAEFGIDRPASIKRLSAGAGPASKFVVEAGEGSADRVRLFLKQRRRSDANVAEALSRHSVIRFLKNAGLPVVEPMQTADGGTALLGRKSIYELSRFVEADVWPGTAASARAAGEMLATIHQSLAAFDQTQAASFRPASGLLAGDGPKKHRAASAAPRDRASEETFEFLSQTITQAADRAVEAGLPASQPQLVHGDFHPGNTRWHGESICAVLDFDACKLGHPIEHAALASIHFALDRRATPMSARAAWPETTLIEAFWVGYSLGGAGVGCVETTAMTIPWIAAGSLAIETLGGAASGAFDTETVMFATRIVQWLTQHADGLGTIIARAMATNRSEHG